MRFLGYLTGFLFLFVLSFASGPVQAQSTPSATPDKFIQDLGDRAIAVISNKSLSEVDRRGQYHAILRDSFDLQVMGKFVLGRTWGTLTDAQRQEYLKLFEANVVSIYGDRLTLFTGENLHAKGARQANAKDWIVNSEIAHPNGAPPTKVDWRVRQENGQYRVVDVSIEGVSQTITQRSEYAEIIQKDSGKIDMLLAEMRKHQ